MYHINLLLSNFFFLRNGDEYILTPSHFIIIFALNFAVQVSFSIFTISPNLSLDCIMLHYETQSTEKEIKLFFSFLFIDIPTLGKVSWLDNLQFQMIFFRFSARFTWYLKGILAIEKYFLVYYSLSKVMRKSLLQYRQIPFLKLFHF